MCRTVASPALTRRSLWQSIREGPHTRLRLAVPTCRALSVRIRTASSTIPRTTVTAGSICRTRPEDWPARKSMESMSPVASRAGGTPPKRGRGIRPPSVTSPMMGSSGRCSEPRLSSGNHRSTNGVRKVRWRSANRCRRALCARYLFCRRENLLFVDLVGIAFCRSNQARSKHHSLRSQRQCRR